MSELREPLERALDIASQLLRFAPPDEFAKAVRSMREIKNGGTVAVASACRQTCAGQSAAADLEKIALRERSLKMVEAELDMARWWHEKLKVGLPGAREEEFFTCLNRLVGRAVDLLPGDQR